MPCYNSAIMYAFGTTSPGTGHGGKKAAPNRHPEKPAPDPEEKKDSTPDGQATQG